jgi:hypothetical protein
VPTRLATDEERVALGRTLGEFNRGIIEILPPGAGRPSEADQQHLLDVARASGRPVFFLGFDATARSYVEAATREGAQLYNLLRIIPFNPRFTLRRTTYFANLDVWDVAMAMPFEERVAYLADPGKRAELRQAATQRQRRRPGVLGRLIKWDAITVGSNMARATPFLGHEGPGAQLRNLGGYDLITNASDARFILLGGRFVGEATLNRFYILHCVAIPLVVAGLIAIHFWRVRKDGGISQPL